jgi:hypothetical protein
MHGKKTKTLTKIANTLFNVLLEQMNGVESKYQIALLHCQYLDGYYVMLSLVRICFLYLFYTPVI